MRWPEPPMRLTAPLFGVMAFHALGLGAALTALLTDPDSRAGVRAPDLVPADAAAPLALVLGAAHGVLLLMLWRGYRAAAWAAIAHAVAGTLWALSRGRTGLLYIAVLVLLAVPAGRRPLTRPLRRIRRA